jgi:hypothetical protein
MMVAGKGREESVKKPTRGVIVSAVVALLAMSLTASADGPTAMQARAAAAAPKYDISKEITVEGTVASVVTKPTPGMLAGAHALLTTSSGAVDAHLGIYAMRGANALALAAGESVKMTGVLVSIKGRPVLLVRTVQSGHGLYTIRNSHGILLRPASASATRPQKDADGGRS